MNRANLKKIIGQYKTEYEYMNTTMSKASENDINTNSDSKYYQFKKFVGENRDSHNKYDPTNNMISEVVLCIFIACLKIIKGNVKKVLPHDYPSDDIPMFLPISYIVKEINRHIFILKHLKSMIFTASSVDFEYQDTEEFQELVDALADASLGGIEASDLDEDDFSEVDEITDSAKNLMLLSASLKSTQQRKEFWRRKVSSLLKNSNSQWLLDQFKYCKWFLGINSYDMPAEEIPPNMMKIEESMDKIVEQSMRRNESRSRPNRPKASNMDVVEKEWSRDQIKVPKTPTKEKVDEDQNEKPETLKTVNITNLMGYIVGFEKKLRLLVKTETNNGSQPLNKKSLKHLRGKYQAAIKRFTSCNYSASYAAIESYRDEQ